MATSQIQLTMNMTDGSSLQMTFGPYATTAAAIQSLKTNVMNFNSMVKTDANWRDALSCIVNSNGAIASSDTPIAAATIITKQSTELLGV